MRTDKVLLSVGVFVLLWGASYSTADSLQVLEVTGDAPATMEIVVAAERMLNADILKMADQTGDLDGDGVQHVVIHDGTELRAFKMSGTSLLETYSSTTDVPDLLVTGGNMRPETYSTDNVITYEDSATYNLKAYVPSSGGTFSLMSYSAAAYTDIGLGNLRSDYTGDEVGACDSTHNYGLVDSGAGFSAAIYRAYAMYTEPNLMDLQHLNMSTADANEDLVLGFDSSGTWLLLRGDAVSYIHGKSGVNVNAGSVDEALFLQAGNVKDYANGLGPDDGVIYRKNGDVEVYVPITAGSSFSEACSGNIGTGVTKMLIGDVCGDFLEEMVVSKGNAIEVYDLSGFTPSFVVSYTFSCGLLDFALGDMDADGKQDIIAVKNQTMGDLDSDCDVDYHDLVLFADSWLSCAGAACNY